MTVTSLKADLSAAKASVTAEENRPEAEPIDRLCVPSWKRSLDVLGTLFLLPLLWPLFAVVAIYIKLVSPGPVFFIQSRVGWGGEEFLIWKFRTMHVAPAGRESQHRRLLQQHLRSDAPALKPGYTGDLIPGGAWIRRLSIDELPQLMNVLRGEMSLVGPRPDLLPLGAYTVSQRQRFAVLPGMTGLWQVSGKNRLSYEEMIDLDLRYVREHGLGMDLRILLRTAAVLVRQRNE